MTKECVECGKPVDGEEDICSKECADKFWSIARQATALLKRTATIEGYLFRCWTPGKSMAFVSIDPTDNSWWPTDQWESVTRTPLTASGPERLIFGKHFPPTSALEPGSTPDNS